jgi:hypothetical protein
MDSSSESCCQACGQHLSFGTGMHSTPPKQLRRSPRISCSIPSVSLNLKPSFNNRLCSDCLNTVELVAVIEDLDENDADNDSLPRPTETFCSRIVSPESSKSRQSINSKSKLCSTCNLRAVPEEFMEYCKCCYARSAKGKKATLTDAPFEKYATTKSTRAGRCRLCTGVVNNSAHQFCAKCYPAKQRDDAKRIQKELYQKQFLKQSKEPPVQHTPYICTDCGGTIHDCSWKTKCPPCYAKVRPSLQGKPKLIKPPFKRLFQGKSKYQT